jgi:hypothetical protein
MRRIRRLRDSDEENDENALPGVLRELRDLLNERLPG